MCEEFHKDDQHYFNMAFRMALDLAEHFKHPVRDAVASVPCTRPAWTRTLVPTQIIHLSLRPDAFCEEHNT